MLQARLHFRGIEFGRFSSSLQEGCDLIPDFFSALFEAGHYRFNEIIKLTNLCIKHKAQI
jgi:hypothetical protein